MIRLALTWLGVIACGSVLVVTSATILTPQRNGILALAAILLPYLFAGPLLFVPLALARSLRPGVPIRPLRLLLLLTAVVFAIRFVPGSVALPRSADPGSMPIRVMSWNLELGQPDPQAVVTTLLASDADLIGLQELTPRHSEAIEADAAIRERFPYRSLAPQDGSIGSGLLSRWPIRLPRVSTQPPLLSAVVSVEDRDVGVVVAHPLPSRIGRGAFVLPTYDATGRDAALATVRAAADAHVRAGRPTILFGDFNVVDREPGYQDLARGLVDVQREVGLGPGLTWRPPQLERLPFGLLRIDMVFITDDLAPISIAIDCTLRGSDHCIVAARLELPGTATR